MASFNEVSERYKTALRAEVNAKREMVEAEVAMNKIGFTLECEVITKAGGEKKVSADGNGRKRAYELAKLNSPVYNDAMSLYLDAQNEYMYNKGMVRLFELQLQYQIKLAG